MSTVPVTAMIPAHQRVEQTLSTIRRLQACEPAPAEILVHVDRRQTPMIEALRRHFPEIPLHLSESNLGPGGARNRMLEAAKHEYVASFDDDSYPHDPDYFARLIDWMERVPDASILAANIFEPHQQPPEIGGPALWTGDFVGCGCVYRRSVFLEAPGYVPIPIAYSMEEADLGLRYTARGKRILFVPPLRIFHDTLLNHHASPAVAAMQVANLGLFVLLRYPLSRWPMGALQFLHKWWDTLARGRFSGALLAFPALVRQWLTFRGYRATVSGSALDHHRRLRSHGGGPLSP